MKSLQARLHVGLGTTLTLLMLVVWWFTVISLDHIGEELISSRLEHDGEALLASLQQDDTGQWHLKNSQVGHIYQRIFSGHYYVIESSQQKIRSRSLWDQQLPSLIESEHIPGPQNQKLLVWEKHFQLNQQDINILVAEDITPLEASLHRFTLFYALICLAILAALFIVQRLVVKHSLVSLNKVRNELEALSEGELASLSSEVPQEIKPLVNEVNRLLQLLAQRLHRSNNAMGNLAHSLKHPLNLLMQLAQQENLDNPTQQELKTQTQKIHQLMERELKRARIAGAGLPGQHFSAEDELPTLVDVLKRVYQHKELEVHYQIDQHTEYKADRNDMLELLGNLLDNACKWSNHQVQCNITIDKSISIIIEDDGPGCDEEKLAQLTERGVRIDESVSGSGLGLAIVKDIVELYQGELEFGRSITLGGFQVTVKLP